MTSYAPILPTVTPSWERKETTETRKVEYGGNYRDFIGETEFDGHYVLWGFEYFPTTYLKSSGLSGDEYRKGGEIRYFRNRKLVFTEFCREPHIAALKVGATLLKLQDSVQWDKLREGEAIYWRDTPATIGYIMHNQGCFIAKAEEGHTFPDHVWAKEEYEKLENKTEVKIDILDPYIWWWR